MLRISKEQLDRAVFCVRQVTCNTCKHVNTSCVKINIEAKYALDLHDSREMIKEYHNNIKSLCIFYDEVLRPVDKELLLKLLERSKEYAE